MEKKVKRCKICKRTVRGRNKSGYCQSCYLAMYQMKKVNGFDLNKCLEECIKNNKKRINKNNSKLYKGIFP